MGIEAILLYDARVEANYDKLREGFEEMTLDACDHWNRNNISECDDGWTDYCIEAYNNR